MFQSPHLPQYFFVGGKHKKPNTIEILREIDHNRHFIGRTTEQQQIIDIMFEHLPECGYPVQIFDTDKYIVVASILGNMSMGYKHSDYEYQYAIKSYRICIYQKRKRELIFKIDVKYPLNNVLIDSNLVLFSTGIYGEGSPGQLFQFNFETKIFRECSDTSRAISILRKKDVFVEIFTYLQTGAYEGEYQIFNIRNQDDLYLNYRENYQFTIISEEDMEDFYSQEYNSVTIDNITRILNP